MFDFGILSNLIQIKMKKCGEKMYALIMVVVIFFNIYGAMATAAQLGGLEVGFYGKSCPSAEAVVRKVVEEAVSLKPGVAASLIRLPFHDCFVRGCDASVLLDSTPFNQTEKASLVNIALRGFKVIDAAKSLLEAACPETVSCADILQFAARDSAVLSKGVKYQVPAGRRDGRTSLEAEAHQNLPSPNFNATQLVQRFRLKGLSMDEMVTLSGSHSVGLSSCVAFGPRLYNFSTTQIQDPSLPLAFAENLKSTCPPAVLSLPVNLSLAVNLDTQTPRILDNKYYVALEKNEGVLTSDQTLMSTDSTAKLVRKYAKHGQLWSKKFAKAMVHMASIEVLTGQQGEIRRNCRVVN